MTTDRPSSRPRLSTSRGNVLKLSDLEPGDKVHLEGDDFDARMQVMLPGVNPTVAMYFNYNGDSYNDTAAVGVILGFIPYPDETEPLPLFYAGELRTTGGRVLIIYDATTTLNASLMDITVTRAGRVVFKRSGI